MSLSDFLTNLLLSLKYCGNAAASVESFGASAGETADQDPEDQDLESQIPEDVGETDGEPTLSALERFVDLMENEMLCGSGHHRVMRWAVRFGVPQEVAQQVYDDIQLSWRQVGVGGYTEWCERRELARARASKIFRMAITKGDLKNAIAANKQIIDLDGLEAPKTLNINASATVQHHITNSSREQVAQLMERMKQLAEQRRHGAMMLREKAGETSGRTISRIDELKGTMIDVEED